MNFFLRALIIILSGFILFSCSNRQVKADNNSIDDSSQSLTIVESDLTILALTKQVLTSVKNKDYKTLVDFIHPTLGVRFSPYAYIDTTGDIKLSRDKFLREIKTQNK